MIGVLPVIDHSAATAWYAKLFGRAADVEPAEGVAEWQIAENAWVQVSADPEPAGRTTLVIGVTDLDAHLADCLAVGIVISEVSDYGFIRTADVTDPAGNTILFVQNIP